MALIGVISTLGIFICIIMLIISAIKKKGELKKWGIGLIICLVGFIIAISSPDNKETSTTNNTNTKINQNDVKKNTFDFSKAELTKENIDKALVSVIDSNKYKGSDITVEKNKNIVDIYYNPGDVWDETGLMKSTANNAVNVMEVLFKNPKVDTVWFWTETTMVDAKGNSSNEKVVNVCLTKANAKDINWTKFKEMVMIDYNKLFDIADFKYIHPGILKKLK